MQKIICVIASMIWILDVCNANIPAINFLLNDSNRLNTLFWTLFWIIIFNYDELINDKS